jgi:hypothetical protein
MNGFKVVWMDAAMSSQEVMGGGLGHVMMKDLHLSFTQGACTILQQIRPAD